MVASHAMAPEHLRANRQLRYATPAIRPGIDCEEQDMEFCYPCPPTFLLPISPAAQGLSNRTRLSNDRTRRRSVRVCAADIG